MKSLVYKRGISLIALVIAVVVLIILTGVVILNSINSNLFDNTQNSVDEYNKKIVIENIKEDIENIRLEKLNEGIYTLNYQADILPILNKYGTLDTTKLELSISDPNLKILLYEITKIPLEEYSTITYTDNNLIITTQLSSDMYTIQYSIDAGATWTNYIQEVLIEGE